MTQQNLSGIFPADFDPGFYRRSNPDLEALDDNAAVAHYAAHGRAEGRLASPASIRSGFLQAAARDLNVLEIGPFFNPAFRGPRVRYFDLMSSAELRNRALELGHDSRGVPEKIDYVSDQGDLTIVSETFDFVFSSHAIEHQPDLVRHLSEVYDLLRPGGCYGLIIPDHRFCFDALLPPSTLADVLAAYCQGRRVHRAESVFQHLMNTTHNDPARHWAGENGQAEVNAERSLQALEIWRSNEGRYVDVHAWQFTPHSFRTLTTALVEMNLSRLRPVRVFDTPRNLGEFCVVLERPV